MADGSELTASSKAEQVTGFYEELAAVVEVAFGGVGDDAGLGWGRLLDAEVLQIAVVADVDRGAGMDEGGDEEGGIEFLCGGEVGVGRGADAGSGERRAGEQVVVLQDHAQGELRRELPVPFAAEDVVVEDGVADAGSQPVFEEVGAFFRAQALEEIGVL